MTNDEEHTKLTVHYEIMLPNTIEVCDTELKIEQEDIGYYSYTGSVKNHEIRIDCFDDGTLEAYVDSICVSAIQMNPVCEIDLTIGDVVDEIESHLMVFEKEEEGQ